MAFQYQILVSRDQPNSPGGVLWYLNSVTPMGAQLPQILNELGAQGWEVCGIGDLGFGNRPDIVLKRIT